MEAVQKHIRCKDALGVKMLLPTQELLSSPIRPHIGAFGWNYKMQLNGKLPTRPEASVLQLTARSKGSDSLIFCRIATHDVTVDVFNYRILNRMVREGSQPE